MKMCKALVEEHLKTGCIIPSKFPQASPFFFIPKKDGTLHPCQDYCYLNSHTTCNAYPLPLIPELIDGMKDSTIFTKVDICWGYNNICLQEEDQWKAALITPMELFKPTIMFFSFCNAPPTCYNFFPFSCILPCLHNLRPLLLLCPSIQRDRSLLTCFSILFRPLYCPLFSIALFHRTVSLLSYLSHSNYVSPTFHVVP